jgi:hypothetical protein
LTTFIDHRLRQQGCRPTAQTINNEIKIAKKVLDDTCRSLANQTERPNTPEQRLSGASDKAGIASRKSSWAGIALRPGINPSLFCL